MSQKIYLAILLLTALVPTALFSQGPGGGGPGGGGSSYSISGDSSVDQGDVKNYSISPNTGISSAQWSALPASAVSINTPTLSETNITFIGNGTVTLYMEMTDNFANNHFLNKTVSVAQTVPDGPPNPTVPSGTNCDTATLTRSGSPPTGVLWYWQGKEAAGELTTKGSGTTFVANEGSGNYYIRAYDNNTSEWSNSLGVVNVTITDTPNQPNVSAVGTVCSGSSVQLSVSNPEANVDYLWYNATGSTPLGPAGNSYTTGNLTANKTYRVRGKRGNCYSPYRSVTVTVTEALEPSVTNGNNTCGNPSEAILTAVNTEIATGISGVKHWWYTVPSGGTGTEGTPVAAPQFTTTFPAPQAGTYYVSFERDGCMSARVPVTATFTSNDTPTLTTTVISGPVCENEDFTILASGGTSQSVFDWYENPTGGQSIHQGTTLTRSSSYANSNNGTVTYYVEATLENSMGCTFSISRTAVDVTILPPVTQTPTVNVATTCGSNTVTLTASGIANATYRWYDANDDFETALNPFTETLSNGTTIFKVSAVVDGCEGPLETVSVTVGPAPGLATGNTSFSRCGNGSVSLTATPGSNANTIRWYNAATGGTLLATGTTYDTPSISSTETYYAESYNSTGGCAASSRLAITASVGTSVTWYLDADMDGYAASSTTSCSFPGTGHTQTVLPIGDCDDGDANITVERTWYQDSDSDGLGDPAVPWSQPSCTAPQGYVDNADDLCPSVNSNVNDCNGGYTSNPQDHNYVYARTYREENVDGTTHFTQNDSLIQEITFLDGLGRPLQQTAIAQSPTRKDIVTFIEYDALGRSEKEWLPYAVTDNAAADFRTGAQTATEQFYNTSKYENTLNPYGQTTFEPSPLDRTDSEAAPGNSWAKGAGHEIEFEYETNTTSDNVRRFRVNLTLTGDAYFPTLVHNGYYDQNELVKVITLNENHLGGTSKLHTMEQFADKMGRTILKRTYALEGGALTAHDTYYVYNDFGNLAFVLPPLMDASNSSLSSLTSNINALAYRYVYDRRNRLVEKQLPGKGKEYVVYNTLDQPIMSQDALQRTRNEWLFTKYDAWGRVAYTGKVTNNDDRPAVQVSANSASGNLWVERGPDQGTSFVENIEIFYNNGAYPTTGITEILTINYYDDYGFTVAPLSQPQTAFGVTSDTRTKGLATGTKVRVLDTGGVHWITTVTHYDEKGRPIYVHSYNDYLFTTDVTTTSPSFDGRVLTSRNQHQRSSLTVVTLDNFTYDNAGRLLEQTQCIGDASLGETCTGSGAPTHLVLNGPTVTTNQVATGSIVLSGTVTLSGTASLMVSPNAGNDAELLVRNTYDELGQLESKEVGGDSAAVNALQTVDYSYNVRGWLTGINDANDSDNTLTRNNEDLFAFRIAYDEGTNALYNGNIARTEWRTANTDTGLKGYDYTYDALNRIKTASGLSTINYDVSNISYDRNGNILTLNRKGHINTAATSFGDMDLLDYSYSGNRLTKVDDSSPNDQFGFKDDVLNDFLDDEIDYQYDDNGNLISDTNKNITNITYNYLNLPTSIDIDSGNISYIYDATGTKIQKTMSSNTHSTDYANGFVYENGQLQFFGHAQGYLSQNSSGGYDYIYQYKDHLGSIRLSFAENPSIPGSTSIIEENNYYPFGLKRRGYNIGGDTSLGSDFAQHWKYNNKEYDESLGLETYDFGARDYNPDLGRWMNIDPLAKNYMKFSPYSFVLNNPLSYNDYNGKFVLPAHIANDPNFEWLVLYLKNDIQKVLKNKRIYKALKKWGRFKDEDIETIFTYGKGPVVNIEDDLGLVYGEPSNGRFYGGTSVLNIDVDIVSALQEAEGLDRDAWLLIFSSTLLHELTHFGQDQLPIGLRYPGEEGKAFELDAYGKDFGQNEFDVAKKHIRDWIKRQQQRKNDLGSIRFLKLDAKKQKQVSSKRFIWNRKNRVRNEKRR